MRSEGPAEPRSGVRPSIVSFEYPSSFEARLYPIGNAQLPKDGRHMRLDGDLADLERPRDPLVRQPRRQQFEHAPLTQGQLAGAATGGGIGAQGRNDERGHISSAGEDDAQRIDEHLTPWGFRNEGACPAHEDTPRDLG